MGRLKLISRGIGREQKRQEKMIKEQRKEQERQQQKMIDQQIMAQAVVPPETPYELHAYMLKPEVTEKFPQIRKDIRLGIFNQRDIELFTQYMEMSVMCGKQKLKGSADFFEFLAYLLTHLSASRGGKALTLPYTTTQKIEMKRIEEKTKKNLFGK